MLMTVKEDHGGASLTSDLRTTSGGDVVHDDVTFNHGITISAAAIYFAEGIDCEARDVDRATALR